MIEAPWTTEQVEQLNRFQRGGFMHPFTCGKRDPEWHGEGVLEATVDGWRCPEAACDYTQRWAHSFMADKVWMDEMVARVPWLGGKS